MLVYLAIDLANPFVPGAFHFTPQEGLVWVEGVSSSREGARPGTSQARESAPVPSVPASPEGPLVADGPISAGHLAAWLVRVRTGDPPAHDSPSPDSEDH